MPWRARAVEDFLAGRTLTEDVAMEAGRLAFEGARGYEHNAFKIPLGHRTVAKALLDVAAMEPSDGGGAR